MDRGGHFDPKPPENQAGPTEDQTMRKFFTIGFTALTLALGAPLAASAAAATSQAPVRLAGVSENASKAFTGADAKQAIENCGCRRRR
jgi:ABC-type proline/glycine betaine transport system substrate-binding protein